MTPPSLIRILKGSRYPWTASVVGNDIIVTGVVATWFGGANDPQDDGETASGVSTKANPHFFGCALPMDLFPSIPPTLVTRRNPCAGSPLPKLPWFSKILVTNKANGIQQQCALIDLGPSAPPTATAAIDLTQSFFVALGGNLRVGHIEVDFSILGGAKFAGIAAAAFPSASSDSNSGLRSQPSSLPSPGLTVNPTFGLPIGGIS